MSFGHWNVRIDEFSVERDAVYRVLIPQASLVEPSRRYTANSGGSPGPRIIRGPSRLYPMGL